MKFRTLCLEKYGAYSGRTLQFRTDAHLHLIAGANEAGKTTALSAIGDLLFEFPTRSAYAIDYPQSQLRIGTSLLLHSGQEVAFRRRLGRKNTIIDNNDEPLNDDLLQNVLGTLSRHNFETEFGLTAARLREGGEMLLAAEGDLAESLAVGSAGLSALNDLKAKLQAEANENFTVRKVSSKAFYVALEDYSEQKSALRDAFVTAEGVANKQAECDHLIAQQKALEDEHKETSRVFARLKRARNTRAALQRLANDEQEWAQLQNIAAVAPLDYANWRAALSAETELQKKLAEAQELQKANRKTSSGLEPRPDLIEASKDIAELNRARGAADQSRKHMPNREQERHTARAQLEDAARALGLKGAQDVQAKIPAQLGLAGIRETVQRRRDFDTQKSQLAQRIKLAKNRLGDLEASTGQQPHLTDPAEFARRLKIFDAVPTDCARLRQKIADIQQSLSDLENDNARLLPPAPALETLARLPLPDISDVEKFARDQTMRKKQRDGLDERLAENFSEAERAEKELKKLTMAGDVATLADLAGLRKERDTLLHALASADKATRDALLAKAQNLNSRLDQLTDDLLANADRAARKFALEQDIAETNNQVEKLRQQKSELAREEQSAGIAWGNLWASTEVEPESPEVMARWLAEVGRSIDGFGRLSANRKEIAALQDKIESQIEPLKGLLKTQGIDVFEDMPADNLYQEARNSLDALQERWTKWRLHSQQKADAKKEIDELRDESALLDHEVTAHESEWATAMQTLCCKETAGHAEATKALEIWDRAIIAHNKFKDEEYRLNGIKNDIANFEKNVSALVKKIAPDLTAEDAVTATDSLSSRLEEARYAAREVKRLQAEDTDIAGQIAVLESDLAMCVATKQSAAAILNCSQAELAVTLDAIARRDELDKTLTSTRQELSAMSDGLSEAQLQAEQSEIDFDALDGEMERLNQRSGQLLNEIKGAAIAVSDARRELEQLTQGRDAALIAQKKQEAAAELLDLSRRWLLSATASRMAGQAIERHRQKSQDPVIGRVSELFGRATGGAFAGMAVDYGDSDQPVFVAQRENRQMVPIGGLSDGTRDQLFLCLRLALLEQRGGEPLPFIGDDLLTSFDDTRTGHALELLAEFGQKRQAILFTHHNHVAELARERLGNRLDLIELGNN